MHAPKALRLHRPMLTLASLMLGLTAFQVQAQVYRIVGPDGKVTFSDRPPAQATAKELPLSNANSPSDGQLNGLPFALRQAASQYPVTFYSSKNCSGCDSARAMLVTRGIPFSEKTITSNADIAALKRITGETAVPVMSIGTQQLKGFSETEWSSYLDAAGYPSSSQLPPSYRRPSPSPLASPEAAQEATAKPASPAPEASGNAKPSEPSVAPARATSTNPAGIQF